MYHYIKESVIEIQYVTYWKLAIWHWYIQMMRRRKKKDSTIKNSNVI